MPPMVVMLPSTRAVSSSSTFQTMAVPTDRCGDNGSSGGGDGFDGDEGGGDGGDGGDGGLG